MTVTPSDAHAPHLALSRLLNPASVAVIGASETAGGYPARLLGNLRRFGYPGVIIPVNPRRDTVLGLPCYPSLTAAPQVPDVALIMVPAAAAETAVAEAASLGVGAAAIYSSGFAEVGEAGAVSQQRLRALAAPSGMRLLGPNSQGYFHLPSRLVASFSTVLEHGLRPGSGIAYVGQSGALGGAILGMADARGLSIGTWLSTGNEADLTATEIAAALLEVPSVEIVVIYLEAVPPGSQWQGLAQAVTSSGKQVVCVRSGVSAAGQRAAASHTGAMTRDDSAFTLIARDCGMIIVDDVEAALDVVELLAARRPLMGPSIGIVTTSGGGGGLAADHAVLNGLSVPPLGASTRDSLTTLVPPFGAVANPVDVTAQLFAGDQARFGEVCRITAADPAVDALVVVITNLTGKDAVDVAHSTVEGVGTQRKPVSVVWLAPRDRIEEASTVLREQHIPVFSSIAAAAAALHRLYRPSLRPDASAGSHPDCAGIGAAALARAVPEPVQALSEWNGAALLGLAGVSVPRGGLAHSPEEAAALASALDEPIVAKIQSPDIAHKSDIGGVRVGLRAVDAPEAYTEITDAVEAARPEARIDGVLVQEQAGGGVDLIIGVRGPVDGYPAVLTIGAGGVATELYRDIASAVVPIPETVAARLVRELRCAPLLTGYRGAAPADVTSLAGAITGISRIAEALGPGLIELEINPLRVAPSGVTALDLLVRLTHDAP